MKQITTYPWDRNNNTNIHPTEDQSRYLKALFKKPPVRCARNFGCNVIGLFPSLKNGKSVEFESGTIERFIIFLMEICPQIVRYKEQPFTLEVPRVNKNGIKSPQRYTPDFLVELESGEFLILEGKSESKLRLHAERGGTRYHQDKSGRWHDASAEEACEKLGIRHLILTERDFNPMLMRNLHFLFDFITTGDPDEALGESLRMRISRQRGMTTSMADLQLEQDELAKAYGFIATGRIASSINFRSIHEPDRFLLFASHTVQAAWDLNQAPRRHLNLDFFHMSPGIRFKWRGQRHQCRMVHNDQVILTTGTDSITYSLDHLQNEWRGGWLKYNGQQEITIDQREAEMPSGRALKEALHRLEVVNGGREADVSARTVRHWKHLVKEAEAAGVNVVDALAPKVSRRGFRQTRIDEETQSDLDKFLRDEYFIPHAPKAIYCFRKYQTRQREKAKIPVGRSTFYRQIQFLKTNLNKKRIGKKKFYAKQGGLQNFNGRPVLRPDGDFAFSIGQIDHTPIDVLVLDTKGELIKRRIWLTVLIDTHTRFILAWYLSFRSPSRISCLMIVRDCVRRHGRLPRTLIVDNGAEFHSHFFRRIVISLGSELLYSPPHQPRHKAISERFFRSVNDGLFHNLAGNTQQLKDPRSMGHDVDPRRLAVETFESLYQKFEYWVIKVYHHRPHQTLGATPNQVFQESCAKTGILLHNTVKADEHFVFETAIEIQGTTRKIHRNWVVVNNVRYRSNQLHHPKFVGQNVEIRWDPEDIRVVYVLLGESWIVAKSTHYDNFASYDHQRLRIVSEVYVDCILAAVNESNSGPALTLPEEEQEQPESLEFPTDEEPEEDEGDWTYLLN